MKIRIVEAALAVWADGEVDRTDGQTHMTKLIDAFRNFAAKKHKNSSFMTSSSTVYLCRFVQFFKQLSIITKVRVNFMLLKDTQTS